MKLDKVIEVVNNRPYMGLDFGKFLYDFVIQNGCQSCLELGFAYGATSMYLVGAMEELGGGHLTSMDLISARETFGDSLEKMLSENGLTDYVTIMLESTSYNWSLMKLIEENSDGQSCKPVFDFCFIDGSKNWTIDGFAFFLVDKLMKEGGWIVFDDYEWFYGKSTREETDGINHKLLSQEEMFTPHIKKVFDLLVMQHPGYSNFTVLDGRYAIACKDPDGDRSLREDVMHENILQKLSSLMR
ncbi:class I SAM-dependent methyltransferase [Candidatus Altiarchaeota archaeon]